MVPAYTLIRGDRHTLRLVIERSGYDFAAAGTTFAAELRTAPGAQLIHTYAITADVTVAGQATLTLDVAGTVTVGWPTGQRLVGELKLSDASLGTQRIVRWTLDVRERVTA